jgi:hypothetical protein
MRAVILSILIASQFAGYAQVSPTDSIPVRLSTLDARKIGSDARLDWKVVCFLQYAKFDIQRSANGVNYTTINSFEADQLRCRQPFDFTDPNITGKVFYRIKVGDQDGKIYHSKIVVISGTVNGFEINSITSSFLSAGTILSISSRNEGNADIRISNFQGLVLKRFPARINMGVTEIPVQCERLPKGNYILTITNNLSDTKTIRFSKL